MINPRCEEALRYKGRNEQDRDMKIYKSTQKIPKGHIVGLFKNNAVRLQVPQHKHEFIEIIYVVSGTATEYIDSVAYDVRRGDMLFINYDSVHSFCASEGYYFFNICFSPETAANEIMTPHNAVAMLALTAFDEMRDGKNGGKIHFSHDERPEIENILNAMLKEQRDLLPSSARVVENYMNILITKMLRKTEIGEGDDADDVWEMIEEYISDNPNGDLSLSTLAKKSFYNPSYFSRVFKQRFGMSLTEYVRTMRVNRVAKLLRDTELTIEQCFAESGFTDRTAFYHAFSKQVGMTPAEYRNKYKKLS